MTLMLYSQSTDGQIHQKLWMEGNAIAEHTIWLDLFAPTQAEEVAVEAYLGMDIPTREEMREIEVSNRLYVESGHLFMTATLMANFDIAAPENHAATFIVSDQHLVTVRYVDPAPFRMYPQRLLKNEDGITNGYGVFVGLIEAVINRAADILEITTIKADSIAKEIFITAPGGKAPDHQKTLVLIGQCGDVSSKVRESLTTLWRVIAYAQQNAKLCTAELQASMAAHAKDISALSDHAAFISSKVSFLLDATLGMINIAQNNIIRIFSIAAVLFLPPTLVASIYGMNFHHMPELDWKLGYPLALGLMVLAAVLPILYFRYRKWI